MKALVFATQISLINLGGNAEASLSSLTGMKGFFY